jgi:hypothetical protein
MKSISSGVKKLSCTTDFVIASQIGGLVDALARLTQLWSEYVGPLAWAPAGSARKKCKADFGNVLETIPSLQTQSV